jgi:DNA replication protein DnaC
VRYVTAAALTNELVEAADERALSRAVARYARLDLLCVDELGCAPRGADVPCGDERAPPLVVAAIG